MINTLRLAALAAVVAVGSISTASAKTLKLLDPVPGTTCSISQFTSSDQCDGIYAGNDSNTNLDGLFGQTGWMELIKIDVNANGPSEQSTTQNGLTLTVTGLPGTSGTWEIDPDFGGYDPIMGVLKGGNSFTVYLFDPADTFFGNWATGDLLTGGGKSGPALSHMSFYKLTSAPPPPPPPPPPEYVPLPAAGWLLLGGLGGLVVMRRRKKA